MSTVTYKLQENTASGVTSVTSTNKSQSTHVYQIMGHMRARFDAYQQYQ
jgi:hypothetical protein